MQHGRRDGRDGLLQGGAHESPNGRIRISATLLCAELLQGWNDSIQLCTSLASIATIRFGISCGRTAIVGHRVFLALRSFTWSTSLFKSRLYSPSLASDLASIRSYCVCSRSRCIETAGYMRDSCAPNFDYLSLEAGNMNRS